jgi:Zn-dependent peptidase ImmA (M78 family)
LIDYAQLESVAAERVHLSHELGHCVTGSFYNPYALLDIRAKHERRANVWAYKQVVPLDALQECFRQGLTEPWQLEDEFDVPAWFIRQAMEYYESARPTEA